MTPHLSHYNSGSHKLIHYAVMENAISTVKVLVKQGHDVNAVTAFGETGLYLAAEQGYQNMIGALLNLGADPRIHRNNGRTPLSIAVKKYDDNAKSEYPKEKEQRLRMIVEMLESAEHELSLDESEKDPYGQYQEEND